MTYFFRVYKQLLQISLSLLFAYRANVINSIIGSMIWGIFSVAAALLLTSKTSNVLGWSRSDLLILTAAQSVFIGVFDVFLSRNFERFPRFIEQGLLDSFILKPINMQLYVSVREIDYGGILRAMIGVLFLSYLLISGNVTMTASGVILFCSALFLGGVLLYGIWFMLITLTIWFTRLTNILELLYTIRGATRFPQHIFKELSLYVYLLLLPITITVARPTELLLHKTGGQGILILLFLALVSLSLSHVLFMRALRSYTSASS